MEMRTYITEHFCVFNEKRDGFRQMWPSDLAVLGIDFYNAYSVSILNWNVFDMHGHPRTVKYKYTKLLLVELPGLHFSSFPTDKPTTHY